MAQILAISSQVVFGPVGNTAAVPQLQRAGHDVMQIPTVLLSHHPGHGTPVVQPIEKFLEILTGLQQKQAFANLDAIFTGYFTSAAQVQAAAILIGALKSARPGLIVLVDPIMGDHGKLYVAKEVAHAICDHLVPLATIMTPNAFELSWLTGFKVNNTVDATIAIAALNCAEVIATSIPSGAETLATVLQTTKFTFTHHSRMRKNVPSGTGDFLAGSYLAQRLKSGAMSAFTKSMLQLEKAISKSSSAVLDLKP